MSLILKFKISIGTELQIRDTSKGKYIENEYALIFPNDFHAYDKRK